jgi:integrase
VALVQKVETRGKAVRVRRAYTDEEMRALLNVAGKHGILYMMAALTGIRHGEFKKLRWNDLNLNREKPSVTVRTSVSKNHRQTCLPLHPVLLQALLCHRPTNVSEGDLVFGNWFRVRIYSTNI